MDLPFSVLLWHSSISALLVMAHNLSRANITLQRTVGQLRCPSSAELTR
jgi:hypothetical protein